MKIAAFVHFYVPQRNAGSETMLHAVLKRLQYDGHDVLVFATDNGTDTPYVWDGVQVVNCTWVMAKQTLEQIGPDVVLTHHQNTERTAKLARTVGCRWVFLMHNDLAPTVHQLRLSPDLTVFNSEYFSQKYGHLVDDSVVVHPPVWPEEHATSPGECVTLVNLNENKGAYQFYWLAERNPHVRFLGVVGAHGDQIRPDIPNVEIVEHTSNMRADVWSRTQVLLMPSVYETYGMVGVEAMASGIPVIAHPTPGLRESLGSAGTFVDRDDVDGWQAALTRLLESQPAYSAASEASLRRSAELDPRPELDKFSRKIAALQPGG